MTLILHHDPLILDPCDKGHMVLIGPQICKWVKFYTSGLSYKSTSHDVWPYLWPWPHEQVKDPSLYIYKKTNLVPIGLIKWGEFYILRLSYNLTSDDLWPWIGKSWFYFVTNTWLLWYLQASHSMHLTMYTFNKSLIGYWINYPS